MNTFSHPGVILKEDYMIPLKLNVTDFAKHLLVSRKQLSLILNEKAGISPLMSLKLAKVLSVSDNFFLNLQLQYDLQIANKKLQNND